MSDDGRDTMTSGPTCVTADALPFRAIVETAVSPFVVVDAQGFVLWAGPSVGTLLGRPAEAYIGAHFLDVIEPSFHLEAIAAFTDFVGPDRTSEDWIGPPILLDLVGRDGPVTCEVSASSGRAIGIDGAVLQVRRWRGTVLLYEAVDAIAAGAPRDEVLGRLVALVEHDVPRTGAAIAGGWDGHEFGFVVATDPVAAELVRGRAGSSPWADAMTTNSSVGDADLAAYTEDLVDAAAAAGFRACWVLPVHVRPDRQPTAAVVLWRSAPGRAVSYLTNSAERVARVAALALEADRNRVAWARAARTDGLTGLSNRLELDDRLDAISRSDPDRPVAALFCDLDEFKPVNDRLGHDVGDAVLARVAERIRRVVRPSDVVARWGGDEFVVLCSEATTSDDALAVARRLVDEINRPMAIAGHEVHLGVSIGVATAEAGNAATLVRDADGALRDAKSAGKNHYRLAT